MTVKCYETRSTIVRPRLPACAILHRANSQVDNPPPAVLRFASSFVICVQAPTGKDQIALCNVQPAVFNRSSSNPGCLPAPCLLPFPLLCPLPCSPTRALSGVGFLLPFPIGLAFILVAIARRQPAPEHARCLIDKQTNERYESEVGESSLAFLLQKFVTIIRHRLIDQTQLRKGYDDGVQGSPRGNHG